MSRSKGKKQTVEEAEHDLSTIKFEDDGTCQHEYDSIDIGMRCACAHVLWSLICKKCKHWKPDTARNDLQHAGSESAV